MELASEESYRHVSKCYRRIPRCCPVEPVVVIGLLAAKHPRHF